MLLEELLLTGGEEAGGKLGRLEPPPEVKNPTYFGISSPKSTYGIFIQTSHKFQIEN